MVATKLPPLVTSGWLKKSLITMATITGKSSSYTPSSLRVLDTSWLPEPHVDGYKEFYQQGHIPGAFYFDLKKLSPKRPDSPVCCPIPDSNFFQTYVENLGISNDTHVVVYSQLDARSSVRSWFLFRLFGHDKVSILNGGMTNWQQQGYEVTSEEPTVKEKSQFKVVFRSEKILNYQSMLKIVENQSATIVDTRLDEDMFYISDTDTSGGHMPGAINIPFPTFFNHDGTFKSNKDLEFLFSSAGVDLSKPVVATCLRAMTACGAIFAAYTLGKDDIPLYNGSWSEWGVIADPKNIIKEKKPQ